MTRMSNKYAVLKAKTAALPAEKTARQGPEPIGNLVGRFLQGRSRDFERSSALMDIWEQLLPPELRTCYRLGRMERETLVIEVPPGPYLHRMKMLSEEILVRLNELCPRSRIRKIRICPYLSENETVKP